jgi:hypothetical protein
MLAAASPAHPVLEDLGDLILGRDAKSCGPKGPIFPAANS